MAEFTPRSERRLYKATLVTTTDGPAITNVTVPTSSASNSSPSLSKGRTKKRAITKSGRAVEKSAYLQSLDLKTFEARELGVLANKKPKPQRADLRKTIRAARTAAAEKIPPALSATTATVAKLGIDSLQWMGESLVNLRRSAAEEGREMAKSLTKLHKQAQATASKRSDRAEVGCEKDHQ